MKLAREIAELLEPCDMTEQGLAVNIIAAKLEPVREACQKMVVYASGPHHYEEIGDADKMYAEAVAAIRSALATLSEE